MKEENYLDPIERDNKVLNSTIQQPFIDAQEATQGYMQPVNSNQQALTVQEYKKGRIYIPLPVRLIPITALSLYIIYIYFIVNPFYGVWGSANAVIFFIFNLPLIALSISVAIVSNYTLKHLVLIVLSYLILIYILYFGGINYIAHIIRFIHN